MQTEHSGTRVRPIFQEADRPFGVSFAVPRKPVSLFFLPALLVVCVTAVRRTVCWKQHDGGV